MSKQDTPKPISKSIRWSFVAAGIALACLSWNSYSTFPTEYAVCSSDGAIHTVDEANPIAECILVSRDRIKAVGSKEHVKNTAGDIQFYEVKPGSILVPGLADAHAHIIEYGFKVQLKLDGLNSISEIVTRTKSYLTNHPDVLNDPSRWIEGMGWDQNRWGKTFPTALDLSQDPLLQSRFIALKRVDAHAVWVSEAVLALMGPLPSTVDGGKIIRDKDGYPTGVFLDNAMALVPFPERTSKQIREAFDTTMQDALKVGLTSIHDASGEDQNVPFYKSVAESGELPLRVNLMRAGPLDPANLAWSDVKPTVNYGKEGHLNICGVKLFMDGALGSWGAALQSPYSDNPSTSGLLIIEPEEMQKVVQRAWKAGWQVNIHAIGDRANKIALDIFESMETADNGSIQRMRPRIEHAQIMSLEDLERIGRLGVIASVQPTHATSDMGYAEMRLGPDRIKGAYAYQTLLQNSPNHVLPLGSDFPIEGINPLLGFYAAVARLSESGDSPHGKGGWYPSEGLSRAQALKGMTLDPAYAAFLDREIGSLEPGKKADFVILDQDIMQIDMSEVLNTKVTTTVVDGRVMYGVLDRDMSPMALLGVFWRSARQIQIDGLWRNASKYLQSRL